MHLVKDGQPIKSSSLGNGGAQGHHFLEEIPTGIIYIYIDIQQNIHLNAYVKYMHVCTYIRMPVCFQVCLPVCLRVPMYVCTYVCNCVPMCLCIYVMYLYMYLPCIFSCCLLDFVGCCVCLPVCVLLVLSELHALHVFMIVPESLLGKFCGSWGAYSPEVNQPIQMTPFRWQFRRHCQLKWCKPSNTKRRNLL